MTPIAQRALGPFLILTLLAAPAAASTPETAPTAPKLPQPQLSHEDQRPVWGGDDFVFSSLSGAAGMAVGATAGGLLGYAIFGDCAEGDKDCEDSQMVAIALPAWVFGMTSTAAGVTLYGSSRGFDGTYQGALIGALLGNLAAGPPIGLCGLIADGGSGDFCGVLAVLAIVSLPAIGGTIGYNMSRSDGEPQTVPSGAIFDVRPDGSLALSPPAPEIRLERRDVAISVPLVGGRW